MNNKLICTFPLKDFKKDVTIVNKRKEDTSYPYCRSYYRVEGEILAAEIVFKNEGNEDSHCDDFICNIPINDHEEYILEFSRPVFENTYVYKHPCGNQYILKIRKGKDIRIYCNEFQRRIAKETRVTKKVAISI